MDPQLARDAAAARMVDKRGAGGGGMGELLAPTARMALMIDASQGAGGEISKGETGKASKVVGDLEVSYCFIAALTKPHNRLRSNGRKVD